MGVFAGVRGERRGAVYRRRGAAAHRRPLRQRQASAAGAEEFQTLFLLHSRISLASAINCIRFLNYILFEVPGILVHAPAHLFSQGIAAELSRRIENVTRNRLMGGAPGNPGARQPADPLPARTLPPDEQMRRIELFCDKVTRLFTSELSMSAADFTFHLVSYLKKQVSAMMEMQEFHSQLTRSYV